MKRTILAALLLLTLAGAARAQAAPASLERDAINLLQGADTFPRIDPSRVRLVAAALDAVRRAVPAVADIPVGPDRSFLVVHAADSAPTVFVERSGARAPAGAEVAAWRVPVTRVGVPAIDSLNRAFGIAQVQVESRFGRSRLLLHPERPLNVPIAAESYARVAQVGWAGPEQYGGDGSWTALVAKGRRLHFVFARGQDECVEGCSTWDYYYVTYDTGTRAVTPDSQLLRTRKWPESVALWDIPTRYTVRPYRTVDDLYAALGDARWWHRQHALVVLGMLLGLDAEQWYGPPERRSPDFAALEQAAAPRRRDSFLALVGRLEDPDPDVAGLALLYLRELSDGARLPGGAAGMAAWRRWVDGRYPAKR